jgi:hypothetical protein
VIVGQYEAFLQSVGDRYLRDVRDLRSGENWDPRLLDLIAEADTFQLFWSSNSMRSPFVKREWEHALGLGRPHFVRPTYWEEPLPESPDHTLPPEELRRLHFHRLPAPLIAAFPRDPSVAATHRKRRLRQVSRRVVGMSLLLAASFVSVSLLVESYRFQDEAVVEMSAQAEVPVDGISHKRQLELRTLILLQRLENLWALKRGATLSPSKQGRTEQSIRDAQSRLEHQLARVLRRHRELTSSELEQLRHLMDQLGEFLSPSPPELPRAGKNVDEVYEGLERFRRELDLIFSRVDGSPSPEKLRAPSRSAPQ